MNRTCPICDVPFLPDAALTMKHGKWRLDAGDGRVREITVASYLTVDMLELLWEVRPFPPERKQWLETRDRLAHPAVNLQTLRRHLQPLGLFVHETQAVQQKWLQHIPTPDAKCPVCHGPDAPAEFRFSPPHGWVAGPGYQVRLSVKKATMLEIVASRSEPITTHEWHQRTQRAFGHHLKSFQTEIWQLNASLERTPVRLAGSRGYWHLAHGFSVPEPLWRQVP